MSRNNRTFFGGDAPVDPNLAPKSLTKQEFGRRLYQLMIGKGWTQSELSRRSGLKRDAISTYVRGNSLPSDQSLKALAAALGKEPEEILPNRAESAIDESLPAMELKVSGNAPDVAWLRINRMVTVKTGLQIMELLNADNAFDRKRGSDAA